MEGNGHWEIRTYRSGRIGEKVKYFVPSGPRQRRERTGEGSGRKKEEANGVALVRKAARAVNNNFRPGSDGFMTLTYTEARYRRVEARAAGLREKDPTLSEVDALWYAAVHEGELLMDRVRKAAAREGLELRYVLVTSDTDEDTGELVRVHHHLVVNRECRELVLEKWGNGDDREKGDVDLWDTADYTPLVEYMLKQVRHIRDAKRYAVSRNLIRPEPKPRKALSGARLREPKGCKLLYAAPYTGAGECQYIKYLLPEEQWEGIWKGKNGGFPDGLCAGASGGAGGT